MITITIMQVFVCDPEFCPGSEYTLVVQFEANPLPTQVVIRMNMLMINMMSMVMMNMKVMTKEMTNMVLMNMRTNMVMVTMLMINSDEKNQNHCDGNLVNEGN